DAPLSVPNEIAIYILSRELKKDITVVLSGEGADEIFSGYGRIMASHHDYARLPLVNSLPKGLRKLLFPGFVKKYAGKSFSSFKEFFLHNYTYFPLEEKMALFTEKAKSEIGNDKAAQSVFEKEFDSLDGLPPGRRIPFVFEKLHLPGLLSRLDTPTMAVAVEGRTPFVDYELVEFALNTPARHKIKWRGPIARARAFFMTSDEFSEELDITKSVLREAFENDVPREIAERKKVGFPVPLDEWFDRDFLETAKKELLKKGAKVHQFFDKKSLEKWLDEGRGKRGFGQKAWMLLGIEYWLREYFP
ncbi:MAG: asparagine synthase C-terminal domain-containing protein, partial [archaeon]|nr:asparagine synthase C-terminal domain-containing protein [archaeon]